MSTSRHFRFHERKINVNHVRLLWSTAFLLNVAGPNPSWYICIGEVLITQILKSPSGTTVSIDRSIALATKVFTE